MEFIEGSGWKACFDEERDFYSVETGSPGAYHLYEITEEVYNALQDENLSATDADRMIYKEGRHLYMDVDDRCGPPYTIVFDEDYKKLCPWAKVPGGTYVWSNELTDAAVEIFASEKNNRAQRRKKRESRNQMMTEKEKMQNNKEPLEIERKFLIHYPDLDLLEQICSKKMNMTQTYLVSEKNCSRRIRKSECRGNTVYWYNEKEKISDMTRIEREREISAQEYMELIKEAIPDAATITKTRYCIPSGDRCFEVDVFPEWKDRAFAEVELENEQQAFEVPDCLSVIREVTEDGRYTNLSLALNGFVYDEI